MGHETDSRGRTYAERKSEKGIIDSAYNRRSVRNNLVGALAVAVASVPILTGLFRGAAISTTQEAYVAGEQHSKMQLTLDHLYAVKNDGPLLPLEPPYKTPIVRQSLNNLWTQGQKDSLDDAILEVERDKRNLELSQAYVDFTTWEKERTESANKHINMTYGLLGLTTLGLIGAGISNRRRRNRDFQEAELD